MPRNSVRCWVPNSKLIRRSGLLLPILTLVFVMSTVSHAQDASAAVGSQARIVRVSYVEGEVVLDSGHGYESVTMTSRSRSITGCRPARMAGPKFNLKMEA